MALQDNDITSISRAKKPKVPSDFDNLEDFLNHARKLYHDDMQADETNREEMAMDHKFAAGRQWDEAVLQWRIRNKKPALTFNHFPKFIATAVGNRRMNETVPKVIPDTDGNKAVAKVREGLMRSIVKNRCADYYRCSRPNIGTPNYAHYY